MRLTDVAAGRPIARRRGEADQWRVRDFCPGSRPASRAATSPRWRPPGLRSFPTRWSLGVRDWPRPRGRGVTRRVRRLLLTRQAPCRCPYFACVIRTRRGPGCTWIRRVAAWCGKRARHTHAALAVSGSAQPGFPVPLPPAAVGHRGDPLSVAAGAQCHDDDAGFAPPLAQAARLGTLFNRRAAVRNPLQGPAATPTGPLRASASTPWRPYSGA